MKSFVVVRYQLVLLLIFALSSAGLCADQAQQMSAVQSPGVGASVLFADPMPLHRLETSAEALVVWRKYSSHKPTLLLFSNDPMLTPVPEPLRHRVHKLASLASQEEIAASSTMLTPNPLMLSFMTVDVALRAGWFSRLAWALPKKDEGNSFSPDFLKQQLVELGLASTDEVKTFKSGEKVLSVTLRETPVVAAPLHDLPEMSGPFIIHFDQSFFAGLYENEISTPAFSQITKVLNFIRDKRLPVLAVTFTDGNLEGRVSLNVRFFGEVLSQLVEQPELFDRPLPVNWKRQADILYLSNFFKNEEVWELAVAMDNDQPEAAWVKFSLFLAALENNFGGKALEVLAEAVKLDKVYALAYFDLFEMAFGRGRPDEAMRMLSLAERALPENIQIKMKMAQLAVEIDDKSTALHLIDQLQERDWSPIYYPDMLKYLEEFSAAMENGVSPALQPSGETKNPQDETESDPRRQRILK